MKSRSSRIYVIRKKYLLLTAIIIITSFLFLMLLNLNTQLNDKRYSLENSRIYRELEEMTEKKENQPDITGMEREKVFLVGENDTLCRVLDLLKLAPVPVASLSGLKEEAEDCWIILDADMIQEDAQLKALEQLAGEAPGNIILYNLDKLDLKKKKVQEILGIKDSGKQKEFQGIRVLNGFWTDAVLEEQGYRYQAMDIELESGRPVYITGYAKDYTQESVVPLVFRNIYKKSAIYGVNGPLMKEVSQGILRGIFSQKNQDYMYPIMDASFMAITPLPLMSEENEVELREEYFRGVRQFSEDILMPDIRMICGYTGQKPTVYARDYLRDENAEVHPDILPGFLKEVNKYNGELGLYLTQENKGKWEEWVDAFLNKENIYSVMSDESGADASFMKKLTGYVSFDYETMLPVEYLEDGKIRLSIIFNVLQDNGQMKLNYWASLFGYGLSSLGINLEPVYYPEGEKWNIVSKNVSEHLENTFIQLEILEPATVGETIMKAAGYGLLESQITYGESEILIETDYFVDKARFMLKTDKKITEVKNGSFRKVGEGYYIVEINQPSAAVKLEPGWQDYGVSGHSN